MQSARDYFLRARPTSPLHLRMKRFRPRFVHRARSKTQTKVRQMRRQFSGNENDNLRRNYQRLLYLEDARDEILRGVRQRVDDEVDQKIRSVSFQETEKQSASMLDQIQAVFKRLPVLATYDHQLLKTCFDIIDKQERRDVEMSIVCTDSDGLSVDPVPPKEWRRKCQDIILTGVTERVAVVAPSTTTLDDDDDTRLFVRLIAARDTIRNDVKHAKALSDLFPSEWDMYSTYTMAYYDSLMTVMKERFSFDLNAAETVELLSWVIHCRDQIFNCQDSKCKPCQLISELQDKFLREKDQHIHDWMQRALSKDVKDWVSTSQPMSGSQGLYTEFPIDILRMLKENIEQAGDISDELHRCISKLCLAHLDTIMEAYTAEAKKYISREPDKSASQGNKQQRRSPPLHLKDRARKHSKEPKPVHFVLYSVALLNNFDKISTHLRELKAAYSEVQEPVGDSSRNNNNRQLEDKPVQAILRKMELHTQQCSDLLLPELLNDLNDEVHSLLTRKWMHGNEAEAVDTMCGTIATYLPHLREPLLAFLVPAIEERLVLAYMKALTDKRIRLDGTRGERQHIHGKIYRESQQLEGFFQEFLGKEDDRMSKKSVEERSSTGRWEVVREMASVLQIDDEETAITEVTFLASKYPDMTDKPARRLLKVRGDFTKVHISKIVASSMGKKKKTHKAEAVERTLFSTLAES